MSPHGVEMAVSVQLLSRDELVFECRIRGYFPTNSERVPELKDSLGGLLKKEENGEEFSGEDFEFDLDEELLTCQNKLSKLEGLVEPVSGDAAEVPPKVVALLNHLSGRLAYLLGKCPKGETRTSFKRLATSVVKIRESLTAKIEKAKEILKCIPTFSEVSSVRILDENAEEVPGPNAAEKLEKMKQLGKAITDVGQIVESIKLQLSELNLGSGDGARERSEVRDSGVGLVSFSGPSTSAASNRATGMPSIREIEGMRSDEVQNDRTILRGSAGNQLAESGRAGLSVGRVEFAGGPEGNRAQPRGENHTLGREEVRSDGPREPVSGTARDVAGRDGSNFRGLNFGEGGFNHGDRVFNSGHRGNYVPLSKWDLTFSGAGVLNANQFLERVEELAETRRVSQAELFEGVLELLSGEALRWFRVHKNNIHSWDHFKRELRSEFLPIAYEEALWKEIRNRKQGQGERVSAFLHCMLSLIGRLREEVSEARKLELVMQNLAPEVALHVRMARPRSLEDLLVIGRELERGLNCIEDYKGSKPLTFKNAVEKDCVFDQGRSRNFHETRREPVECFNCRGDHFVRDCPEPRSLKCYGCGKPGVTKRDCDCGNRNWSKNERRD